MRKRIASVICAGVAALLLSGTAMSEPTKLTKEQLDAVVAGAITATQVNNGGNIPNGVANGVPTVNLNPAGSAPPGQNK